MGIEIKEFGPEILPQYAEIPIRFRIESVLRVEPIAGGFGGLRLIEEHVKPYLRDYDEHKPERVVGWAEHYDVSRWGFFMAIAGHWHVGGATVAYRAANVPPLEGRDDLAVLWDMRVHPNRRGEGIGAALFRCVVDWARRQGCRELKIEIVNSNVRGCRFYAKQGCELRAIHNRAFPPPYDHEAQLLWYLRL